MLAGAKCSGKGFVLVFYHIFMSNYGWWPQDKIENCRSAKDIAFRGVRSIWRIERFLIPFTIGTICFYAYYSKNEFPFAKDKKNPFTATV